MAKPLRIEFRGASHQVTTCGNERRAIVRDGVDRWLWVSLVERTVDCHGCPWTRAFARTYDLLRQGQLGSGAVGQLGGSWGQPLKYASSDKSVGEYGLRQFPKSMI